MSMRHVCSQMESPWGQLRLHMISQMNSSLDIHSFYPAVLYVWMILRKIVKFDNFHAGMGSIDNVLILGCKFTHPLTSSSL